MTHVASRDALLTIHKGENEMAFQIVSISEDTIIAEYGDADRSPRPWRLDYVQMSGRGRQTDKFEIKKIVRENGNAPSEDKHVVTIGYSWPLGVTRNTSTYIYISFNKRDPSDKKAQIALPNGVV